MAVTDVALLAHVLGTKEDAEKYLGLPATLTDDEDFLHRIMNAAIQRVETFCRRPFLTRALDEFYKGSGARELYLRKHPVISITSVDEYDHEGTSINSWTGSDMLLDTRLGVVHFKDGWNWTRGIRKWQVVYVAGWATLADVPDDVVLAWLKTVAWLYRKFDNKNDDVTSQTVDGQTVFYSQDIMPREIRSLLGPHRVPTGIGNT